MCGWSAIGPLDVCSFFSFSIILRSLLRVFNCTDTLQHKVDEMVLSSAKLCKSKFCRHRSRSFRNKLNHFWPMFPFYTSWKHQKTFGNIGQKWVKQYWTQYWTLKHLGQSYLHFLLMIFQMAIKESKSVER